MVLVSTKNGFGRRVGNTVGSWAGRRTEGCTTFGVLAYKTLGIIRDMNRCTYIHRVVNNIVLQKVFLSCGCFCVHRS